MKRQRHAPVDATAPFLRHVSLKATGPAGQFPFSIPAIAARRFELLFNTPVTIFVGDNGSGKSTILEGLASLCGFGEYGGSRNFRPAWQEALDFPGDRHGSVRSAVSRLVARPPSSCNR